MDARSLSEEEIDGMRQAFEALEADRVHDHWHPGPDPLRRIFATLDARAAEVARLRLELERFASIAECLAVNEKQVSMFVWENIAADARALASQSGAEGARDGR